MDAILKAAWLLVGFVSFTLGCVTPVAAESEQVQFYNSPAAAAAKLPFSGTSRKRAVHVRCHRRLAGQKGIGSRRD
jgi:hypothetical protein